jgi:hypothetical protein
MRSTPLRITVESKDVEPIREALRSRAQSLSNLSLKGDREYRAIMREKAAMLERILRDFDAQVGAA